MTRYYSKTDRRYGNRVFESVVSLSSQPNEDGTYASAEMEISHHPAKETLNFDLSRGGPTSALNGALGEQKVNEETGYHANELDGHLYHAHNLATFAAGDIEEARNRNISKNNASWSKRRRLSGIEYAKNIKEIKRGTSQLFTPTPATTKVDAAFSHTSMRTTVPIIGAYFHQKYGDLTASDDLSEHSSRMARHAERMGLPIKRNKDNPDLEVTNNFDFRDVRESRTEMNESWDRIPDATMHSAKEHYKEIRGLKKTPKPLSSQFNQLQFPGMEDK
jgi:hypothetical protein